MLLLKWPVLLLVICVAAGAFGYVGARKFHESGRLAMQAAQVEHEQSEALLRLTREEEKMIRNSRDKYRQLQTTGVIGDERRLELVEALGHIRARHKLYPLQFDIGRQASIQLQEESAENAGASLSLRSSLIQIVLPLLHEEDLTRLLHDLRRVGQGLFVVEECSISRGSEAESVSLELKENLSASCRILWLTLKYEEPGVPEDGEEGAGNRQDSSSAEAAI